MRSSKGRAAPKAGNRSGKPGRGKPLEGSIPSLSATLRQAEALLQRCKCLALEPKMFTLMALNYQIVKVAAGDYGRLALGQGGSRKPSQRGSNPRPSAITLEDEISALHYAIFKMLGDFFPELAWGAEQRLMARIAKANKDK